MSGDAFLMKCSSAYPKRDEEDETLHVVSWRDFSYMDADVWNNFQQGTGITRSTNNRRNGQYRGRISHLRHSRKDVVALPPHLGILLPFPSGFRLTVSKP
ncbi:hypothetical protein FOMG_19804 [Fusarium oxysporum f. sp. melonis 26406]|uniref:Uncharacterized protein n=1 Tax=Fusarium oxysporum f. sp. melonis 26406 TaxID=1089452 RepID=W9ZQK8_FUSOX|nr:hypothetical protein FOMG_19804 [Fusarium oxysporum f. sp. melonis 26406]